MNKLAEISLAGSCKNTLIFALVDIYGNNMYAASYYGRTNLQLSSMLRYISGGDNRIWITESSKEVSGRASNAYYIPLMKEEDKQYRITSLSFNQNMENIGKSMAIRKDVGQTIVITDEANFVEDMYNALSARFAVPVEKDWIPYILKEGIQKRAIYKLMLRCITADGESRMLPVDNVKYDLDHMVGYNIQQLSPEVLESIIESGLNQNMDTRPIAIAHSYQKGIDCSSMDNYMIENSLEMREAVQRETSPLAPINGTVEEVRLKHKRLFSQQGVMVNAANTLLARRKNVFLLEGMGVGKTLQALAIVLKYAVDKAKKRYPKMTLKEIYMEQMYSAFVWVLCPGQLCEKWKREAEREIPGLRATILQNLSETIAAVELENRERDTLKGIRLYILSKDTAKLGAVREPAVLTKGKYGNIVKEVCKACATRETIGERKLVYREMKNGKLQKECKICSGREWVKIRINETKTYGKIEKSDKVYGVACPYCGELLLKNCPSRMEEDSGQIALSLSDFSKITVNNRYCMSCGQPLWGDNVKNVRTVMLRDKKGEIVYNADGKPLVHTNEIEDGRDRWVRVTYYTTYQRSSRASIFAPKGREAEFLDGAREFGNFPEDGVKITDTLGPRRYPLALYIKKYARKADFVILDEVHKYAQESGQGYAAHCLVRASKKSLSLTGTISNGMASSMFHLLWMTEPAFMVREGFTIDSKNKFIKTYGTMEQTYLGNYSEDENTKFGTIVKSKQLGKIREKAGLSPLMHIKLLGKSVFLDLDDFTQSASGNGEMPPLTETTRLVEIDDSMRQEYFKGLRILREQLKTPRGRRLLSKTYLYGLYYLDKPYQVEPIYNPERDNSVIYRPKEMTEIEYDKLIGGSNNKEKQLIADVNDLLQRGERAFIFCENTGRINILPRLKKILVKYTALKEEEIQTVNAAVPIAKREEWMRQTAEKHNTRIFLCNPALTDTGIDFIFYGDNGKEYNYNNILFYQLGTQLAVQWQASRRSYRLNQHLPCNVIYYAYAGTLQATLLELMGLKIASVSAAQGRFSSSALAAMSADIDPRVKLAEALMSNKVASADEIGEIFQNARIIDADKKNIYEGFASAGSFWDLIGITEEEYKRQHGETDEVDKDEAAGLMEDNDMAGFTVFLGDRDWDNMSKNDNETEKVIAALTAESTAIYSETLIEGLIESFEFGSIVKRRAKKKRVAVSRELMFEDDFDLGF